MNVGLLDRGTGSLFAQVFALALVAIVGAQAINLWIVFHLPPPTPIFYTEGDVLRSLRGAEQQARNGPPLIVHNETNTLQLDPDARIGFTRFRTLLAVDLGLTQDDIFVITEGGPPDRRGYRLVRDRLGDGGQPREESFIIAPFKVAIHMKSGRWVTIQPAERHGLQPWQQRLAIWFAISAVALVPLAYFFARGLARPMSSFAEAAERFGRDPRAPPITIKGSSEILMAATAFNEMQDRLRRYVEDRTSMVAAIAHDLRTPLTRLRFRVEAAPEDARAKMNSDID